MMANEIGTPTLESAPLSNAFYKGDSAYEIAVKHGFTGTEEEWLALMHPLIVRATKQAKAEGETSTAETYVVDHTAKEIYDAAAAGRIVKLYVPQDSGPYTGGAYYQLSSYSYDSKTDKYTLRFTQPGSDSYESSPGNANYQDGDGKAYLPGVRVQYIEGLLMAPDGTTLKSDNWSAYDTVPALDLVKANIRAELAAETTRADTAEKANAAAISAEATRAKAAEQVNADAIATETTRAEKAEKANAAAAAEALSKANEAMEIYDSDNDVKYTYTIYAQQGIPHMALTKVTT